MRLFLPCLLGISLGFLPELAFAQDPCVTGLLPCGGGGGAGGLANYIRGTIGGALLTVFSATMLAMLFYYAGQLLIFGETEETIKETKEAYQQALTGAVVVGMAAAIVNGFGVGHPPQPSEVVGGLRNVVFYLKFLVGAAATVNMVIQGFRLITSQGEEEAINKARQRFIHGLIGVSIIILAGFFIDAAFPGVGTPQLALQIAGVARVLLELFGALTVLSFIVAGAILLLSTEESAKDTAKKIIFGSVIALVVVLCSYIIVFYFVFPAY